ncbi:hypothetical protein HanXRQr2_Chr17g0795491 [Helianthus annuus]|uniref:Uncharacterized protein n=1 Tax=Helianthus annuus TaxID=4232 RepID=A0A251RNG0_HELAN|nr:hypothetical protein HanXRQr2_Chr17g0795491 [Helianthus annuus]KAJ0812560.1 hypothetical protein HanPSC8_Chr17g0763361 [Helianthus annuus]
MLTGSASKRAQLPKKHWKNDHMSLEKPVHPHHRIQEKRWMDSSGDLRIAQTSTKSQWLDEHKDSKLSLITKDEEEAAQAFFALAQTFTETCMNKTSDMELSSIMVPPNQTEETNVKNVLQKRCLVHVYVCHFIKVVQTAES